MEPMVIAIWMLFWGVIGAFICQGKGRATLGFLLGAALGPLGLLLALLVRDRRTLCPHCRSPLLAPDAAVCARCGRAVDAAPPAAAGTADLQAAADARARSATVI